MRSNFYIRDAVLAKFGRCNLAHRRNNWQDNQTEQMAQVIDHHDHTVPYGHQHRGILHQHLDWILNPQISSQYLCPVCRTTLATRSPLQMCPKFCEPADIGIIQEYLRESSRSRH